MPASPAERDLLLLTLAWPAIIEMSLHMLVWVIDTAMLARLGAEALSAVSLGTQVMVSQATGRGDKDACRAIAGAGVGGAAALGILLTFGLRAVAPHVFRLAAMGQAVTVPGTGYMRLVALAACFMVPTVVATGAMRGQRRHPHPAVHRLDHQCRQHSPGLWLDLRPPGPSAAGGPGGCAGHLRRTGRRGSGDLYRAPDPPVPPACWNGLAAFRHRLKGII